MCETKPRKHGVEHVQSCFKTSRFKIGFQKKEDAADVSYIYFFLNGIVTDKT